MQDQDKEEGGLHSSNYSIAKVNILVVMRYAPTERAGAL